MCVTMKVKDNLNIAIVGGGYIGLSLACMLAPKHNVKVLDIDAGKVDMINRHVSPLSERGIIDWFRTEEALRLSATTDPEEAYADADAIFVAVPTDFDESCSALDTTHVEQTVKDILKFRSGNPDDAGPMIVIRSTLPIGCTAKLRSETGRGRILFAPEFLREGCALKDCLSPSRVIIGADTDDPEQMRDAETVLQILRESSATQDFPTMIINSSEAEAVKLFSNTYLAMRVAFFNELDSFAESAGLNASDIIDGMGKDPRIGSSYNNPSFGYGGYCLPKDSRQLQTEFADVPQKLVTAVVESNPVRIEFVADQILRKARLLQEQGADHGEIKIGVYRLNMKKGSDNYRQSATMEVLKHLAGKGCPIEVYEPLLEENALDALPACSLQNDLDRLKAGCSIIIANRMESCLEDVREKLYTRDLFHKN